MDTIIIILTAIICYLLYHIKNWIELKLYNKRIKRKTSNSFILEGIFLFIIFYSPILVYSTLNEKGFMPDDKFFSNKVMYYSTAAIFAYNMFRYITNTIEHRHITAMPYRPVYIVNKLYLDKKLSKRERNTKEVQIKITFPEGNAKLRNINVYKLNVEDVLEPLTSYAILNDNDTIYKGSLKNDLLVVADTLNRERIFTLITEHNIMNAIDNTYRLNFHKDDLAYSSQDPMYESDKNYIIKRLDKIISKSIYYKKTK